MRHLPKERDAFLLNDAHCSTHSGGLHAVTLRQAPSFLYVTAFCLVNALWSMQYTEGRRRRFKQQGLHVCSLPAFPQLIYMALTPLFLVSTHLVSWSGFGFWVRGCTPFTPCLRNKSRGVCNAEQAGLQVGREKRREEGEERLSCPGCHPQLLSDLQPWHSPSPYLSSLFIRLAKMIAEESGQS